MWTRRKFARTLLRAGGLLALWPAGCARYTPAPAGVWVNDVHSQLNLTRVEQVVPVGSVSAVREAVRAARARRRPVCVAAARHAMGGQQFATDAVMLDTTGLDRVVAFDREAGTVEVEAGIHWPELVAYLLDKQPGALRPWTIAQKQTGASRLSLGGAVAANVHGRGLTMKPIIGDVASLTLVDAAGELRRCSRRENPELFGLVVGGYGLFGVVVSVTLKLVPREKLQRVVDILPVEQVAAAFEQRIAEGFSYGDFQFATDERSDDYMRKGIFACYRPVDPDTPIPPDQKRITLAQWQRLVYFAHTRKSRAFDVYMRNYLATSGQIYWADLSQMGTYRPDYHREIDRRLGYRSTEIITEIYVPRPALADFMAEAREDFRRHNVNLIYGTIRLIERDDESFLAWARQPYACVIFNLCTRHTPQGIAHSAEAFRRLIDMAIRRDGSYYLTYHRFATRDQLLACYPQFPEFLRLKLRHDPDEQFHSDWYRHVRQLIEPDSIPS
jgi:FAD/FMN-containing dehydrogenase